MNSIKVITVSGIPVKLHWTFPLLLVAVIFLYADQGWQAQIVYVGMLLSVFLCVVLHEFGHALSARRYGVKTVDIILSPIGGIARLNKLPTKPIQEFIVAIAGPLVNVAIAILIALYLLIFSKEPFWDLLSWPPMLGYDFNSFLAALLSINIGLVLFNLIPAFPLDGGRIFRALLSTQFGRLRATKYAANTGRILAIGIGIYGIMMSDYILLFIAVFVFVSATSEYQMVKTDALLSKYTVREVMQETIPIGINDHLEYVKHRIMTGNENIFVVVNDEDKIVGLLKSKEVIEAIGKRGSDFPITDILTTDFKVISPTATLSDAFHAMQEGQYQMLPVFEDTFLGTIDLGSINGFLSYQHELSKRQRQQPKSE